MAKDSLFNFRENWLIFLGIWGEAELILGIWGAKEKYFQGAEVLSFRELGRSMHYFHGSREHRPPGGLNNSGTTHYDSLQGSYWEEQKNSHNEVIMTSLQGQ